MNSEPTPQTPHLRDNKWVHLLAEWKASNQSQKEFCKLRQLSLPSFAYWRKKLALKKSHPEKPKKFASCKVIPNSAVQESKPDGIELRLPNGCILRISHNVNQALLSSVLTCLGVRHANN